MNFAYLCLSYLNGCPCQSLISDGLFHFLPIKGYGREIPWGCARNIFQGSQGLKLSRGVRASFPEGSYQLGQALQWGHTWKIVFLWAIFGITPWNSSPKANLENCLPYRCMDKKWNSPIFIPASIQGPQCDVYITPKRFKISDPNKQISTQVLQVKEFPGKESSIFISEGINAILKI